MKYRKEERSCWNDYWMTFHRRKFACNFIQRDRMQCQLYLPFSEIEKTNRLWDIVVGAEGSASAHDEEEIVDLLDYFYVGYLKSEM